MLSPPQLREFHQAGHLTLPGVLSAEDVSLALADISQWSHEYLARLTDQQRKWYLETTGSADLQVPRKLDNPVFHRPFFQNLAGRNEIVSIVEQLIGPSVSVFFSQVFMKPSQGGGPKPVHQDNFYFGPDDPDALLTVWVALDDATVENGCLFYGEGSHRSGILDHFAPEDEPFNLQVAQERVGEFQMRPAPVPSGGISIHHGNTLHQSSSNTSNRPRRAVAIHYLRNDVQLVRPALDYEETVIVRIS